MSKKVWIITHHASPPQYETRIRNNAMAKYLMRAGYDVTIFGSSTIHNTDINLIEDESLFIKRQYDDLKYIHVNSPKYTGNGLMRKINLLIYPQNLLKTIKKLNEKPDIIINDLDVTAFNVPFKIKKYVDAPIITEVRDLWPESIVVYGYMKRSSLLAKFLYYMEKRLYAKSDRIVYTMEGWPDYIKRQGWEGEIDLKKTYHINNGLDLELFDYNRDKYIVADDDLNDCRYINVVYTGSIRRVNNLGILLDVAKLLKETNIRFLIWGSGDEEEVIKKRILDEEIKNVVFKGRVEKKYIPSIVSQATINIAHNTSSDLFEYGISFNKIFDYFAAGRPIFCDFKCTYNPVIQMNAGFTVESIESKEIANRLVELCSVEKREYEMFSRNARKAATEYDFLNLTNKMIAIIEAK